MRSRGIILHRSVAAVIAVGSLLTSATVANAGSVATQKQKVDQLADQLDDLENRLGTLDEDYGAALDRKAQLDQEIADSQAKISQQEARLTELAGVLGDIAVDKYVSGSALELSPLFSNAAAYTEAEQKDALTRLALDSGSGSTDEMLALSEDLAKEQASLEHKQEQVADLVASLDAKMAEAQTLQAEYEQKLSSAQSDLARSHRAGARAARRGGCSRRDREAAAGRCGGVRCRGCQPEERGRRGTSRWRHQRRRFVRQQRDPGTAGTIERWWRYRWLWWRRHRWWRYRSVAAVQRPPFRRWPALPLNAAMSQLGVPYRFAAESPGVAFDCSGLTKYAWGQAGVYLPHQSRCTVRIDPACPAERGAAGRPHLLQVADRPRCDVRRRRVVDPCAGQR